jgi:hypothetical protein
MMYKQQDKRFFSDLSLLVKDLSVASERKLNLEEKEKGAHWF